MGKYLFDSWHQWSVCMKAGIAKFGWGLWRVISGIILGIVSVFVYIGKQIEAFCRREPLAALVVSTIIVILATGWVMTYVDARTQLVTTEYQRDSIGHTLDKYMEIYTLNDTLQ